MKTILNQREQAYVDATGVYPTRYAADKVRKNSVWHRSDEIIIKVEGGYELVDGREYWIRKAQR
ncbi:MAG: hypothetical protein IKN92_04035 [Clostridia bacterium]|nr:hypothetical protein [Clostridia bacterium]